MIKIRAAGMISLITFRYRKLTLAILES